jgi:hypothetical protein
MTRTEIVAALEQRAAIAHRLARDGDNDGAWLVVKESLEFMLRHMPACRDPHWRKRKRDPEFEQLLAFALHEIVERFGPLRTFQ